jgi:hypothetical protein
MVEPRVDDALRHAPVDTAHEAVGLLLIDAIIHDSGGRWQLTEDQVAKGWNKSKLAYAFTSVASTRDQGGVGRSERGR